MRLRWLMLGALMLGVASLNAWAWRQPCEWSHPYA